MEYESKVNQNYSLMRAYLLPGYMIERSEQIIGEQERVEGKSPAKNLVRAVSYGWEGVKLACAAGAIAGAYTLLDRLLN
jgi:hypothetical protein